MLHPLAQDGIFRITADFDRDTLADFYVRFFARIRDLDAVASRTSRRPVAQDDIDRLDLPLHVGRVALFRPCPAGLQWLKTHASAWWGENSRTYTFAMAYVMAHRGKKTLSLLYKRSEASLKIWAWACACGASEEAIRRAALALMPPPDESLRWFITPDEPKDEEDDLYSIALGLSKTYGHSITHWLFDSADEDFWKAVCDMQDSADASRDAISLQKGLGHDPDGWWYRQRSALAAIEKTLKAETKEWLATRNKPEQPEGT